MLLHYRNIVDGREEGGTLLLILLKREDEPVHQSEIAEKRGEAVYAPFPVGYGYKGFAVDDGEDAPESQRVGRHVVRTLCPVVCAVMYHHHYIRHCLGHHLFLYEQQVVFCSHRDFGTQSGNKKITDV